MYQNERRQLQHTTHTRTSLRTWAVLQHAVPAWALSLSQWLAMTGTEQLKGGHICTHVKHISAHKKHDGCAVAATSHMPVVTLTDSWTRVGHLQRRVDAASLGIERPHHAQHVIYLNEPSVSLPVRAREHAA